MCATCVSRDRRFQFGVWLIKCIDCKQHGSTECVNVARLNSFILHFLFTVKTARMRRIRPAEVTSLSNTWYFWPSSFYMQSCIDSFAHPRRAHYFSFFFQLIYRIENLRELTGRRVILLIYGYPDQSTYLPSHDDACLFSAFRTTANRTF